MQWRFTVYDFFLQDGLHDELYSGLKPHTNYTSSSPLCRKHPGCSLFQDAYSGMSDVGAVVGHSQWSASG